MINFKIKKTNNNARRDLAPAVGQDDPRSASCPKPLKLWLKITTVKIKHFIKITEI